MYILNGSQRQGWRCLRYPGLEIRTALLRCSTVVPGNTATLRQDLLSSVFELEYFLFPQVSIMSPLWGKPPLESSCCTFSHSLGITTKGNFQGPLPNASGSTPDTKQPTTPGADTSEQPRSHEKPGTTSHVTEPVCVRHFHRHHVYQKQLIEKQRKKLEEQQKTIQKLKKKQRLAEARWAAERAAAVTEAQGCLQSKPRGAAEPQGTCQTLLKYVSRIRAPSERVWKGFSFEKERLLNIFAWLIHSVVFTFPAHSQSLR